MESYGQPLEQEHRLSCVLGDCGGASANFLDQFDGRLVIIIIIIINKYDKNVVKSTGLQGHFTTERTRSESNIMQKGKSSDTVRAETLEEKFCFEALPVNC